MTLAKINDAVSVCSFSKKFFQNVEIFSDFLQISVSTESKRKSLTAGLIDHRTPFP